MFAGSVNWVVAGRSAQGVGSSVGTEVGLAVGTNDGGDVGLAVGTALGSELVGIADGVAVGVELTGASVGATPTPTSSMLCCTRRDCHELVLPGRINAASL